MYVARNGSPECFVQFGFLLSKPRLFFLKSSLEFNSHCGQPKCIGVLVSSPIDQSFCSVLWQRNNNLRANCAVVVVEFFFFTYGRRHNAKYAS